MNEYSWILDIFHSVWKIEFGILTKFGTLSSCTLHNNSKLHTKTSHLKLLEICLMLFEGFFELCLSFSKRFEPIQAFRELLIAFIDFFQAF